MKLNLKLIFIYLKNEVKEIISFLINLLPKKHLEKKEREEYLNHNSKFWSSSFDKDTKNKILINLYYPNPEYTIPNLLIGKFIQKEYGFQCVGLIREKDKLNKSLVNSFGIKDFIILKDQSFLNRLKNFVNAFKILKKIKNIDELLLLKIENIDFGKIIYDHYIRNECKGTVNILDEKFVLILSKALYYFSFSKKIFSTDSFKYFIQSEKHWVPANVFFQHALLKKITILSRIGSVNNFGVRLYDKYERSYLNKNKISNNVFEYFHKNADLKKNIENISKELIINRFGNIPKRFINYEKKKYFCETLNLDVNKPIVCIFSNNIIDGIFSNEWSLFKDNLTWLLEVFDKIQNIDDVNWIIKSHPIEENNKKMIKTLDILNSSKAVHKNNIKFLDHKSQLQKYIHQVSNVAISAHGSVAMEYPSLGIPCIIAGDAFCSGNGFTIEPKTKTEYFEYLNNIKKINFLDDEAIYRARLFLSLYYKAIKINLSIFSPQGKKSKSNFWIDLKNNLENYDNHHKNNSDLFLKNLKIQLNQNSRHLVNYDFI